MPCVDEVVFTANRFTFGGRESFIAAHADELRSRGCFCTLLGEKIVPAASRARFDHVTEVPIEGLAGLARWSTADGRDLTRTRTLIWAHHYALAPAWVLGALSGCAMLPSFHGPLDGVGAVDSFLDRLGVALALVRRPFCTAVSPEVARSVRMLHADADVRLLPNRVRVNASARPAAPSREARFLMATRGSKLGHVRAAVDFLADWLRHVGPAKLRIVGAGQVGHATGALQAARLLGRKWCLARASRLRALAALELAPPTDRIDAELAEADLVLGMGRSLLEGLAARRPSVLVGYDRVIDLIGSETFANAAETNFSGRAMASRPPSEVAMAAASALAAGTGPDSAILHCIDIRLAWRETEALLAGAAACPPTAEDAALAGTLASIAADDLAVEQKEAAMRGALSEAERSILARLEGKGATAPAAALVS